MYFYYLYFIDEETDLQRLVICSDTEVVRKDVGFNPNQYDSEALPVHHSLMHYMSIFF